ncbi:hypothetical protein HBH56_135360 [Parastagonospora nodorum]|nr:hypothetical protein HBH56_135360 [Parastagonospora nodorum]KAH4120211.1 hypothetical protein HBH47_119470 [Parastagonospora nodorum]KAH4233164.1 hypothetical protein HBI06_070680 [Parastagonospora nodorum]KAH4246775.1 hypothetical protein HBI05_053900 [Parastagonospora nodorum]KAH4339711.1 hypothetical protein HBH98_202940 [Parastagonospora nodorum]
MSGVVGVKGAAQLSLRPLRAVWSWRVLSWMGALQRADACCGRGLAAVYRARVALLLYMECLRRRGRLCFSAHCTRAQPLALPAPPSRQFPALSIGQPCAETILQKAAEEGALDSAEWPKTLQYILDRLDEIVNDFPKSPASSTAAPEEADSTPRPQNPSQSQESHATDKENAPPTTPSRPAIPAFATTSNSTGLPQDVTNFYSTIRATLSKNFAKNPPHTVQRLAELVLEPRRKYKYLPPYLRALDRVVSVSSPLSLFPLPLAVLPTSGGLLNGTTSAINTTTPTLGSDESLGGALLTPIPWLQSRAQNELVSESTEIVDGPNGAGRIETVTVGMLTGRQRPDAAATPSASSSNTVAQIASSHPDGESLPSTGPVTQGELLRQEQEAGIVLNNPHSLTTSPTRTTYGETAGGGTIIDTVEGEEEPPHARGPEKIGMEDTGPQKVAGKLDIEGAVGRPSVDRASKSPGPAGEIKDEDMKDSSEKTAEDKDAEEEKAEVKTEASEDVEMKSED